MENLELKIIYEDNDLLVIDKPAGLVTFSENKIGENNLVDYLLEKFPYLKNVGSPPRYGILHRLDKETSGILLIAKNNKALEFFQKQFQERKVVKKYLALVVGNLKSQKGEIKTLIGRSPKDRRKQKVYLPQAPNAFRKREAITFYQVLKNYKNYALIEVEPKTGRKHQIRTHLAYFHHPVAGDKLYRFKNQIDPKGLKRQFLHAHYLKIEMPNGREKEFKSDLPEDLKKILKELPEYGNEN